MLDAERNVIQDQRIMVRRDETSVVNVYKSAAATTYNCAPQCNPSIMPGDDDTYLQQDHARDRARRWRFSEKAAEAAPASGQ